ncbi:MAG: hypothetical protein ABJH82_00990 [Polaribacter sp.]|uniref:hypothetical protein n=1 Tax=Polaribacter sp. TaxID=1920175 RepID=UPI003267CD56
MKKIIGILGVVAIVMTMFMNINISSSDNNSKFSDLTLQSFVKSAYAQTECDGPTCVPVDCPWWNPFCDDWDGSDGVTTYEYIGLGCVTWVTDCYPGSGSCSEGSGVSCS